MLFFHPGSASTGLCIELEGGERVCHGAFYLVCISWESNVVGLFLNKKNI
jgi:hypothetical protein